MPLIICTKRVFLTCDDIVTITVNKQDNDAKCDEDIPIPWKDRLVARILPQRSSGHTVEIQYFPTGSTKNNRDMHLAQVAVETLQEALDLFAEIVREVREQKPDDLYLDKLVEKMLGDTLTPSNGAISTR